LSGGEKQRVAVGRALIKDPTFCFADEPTSALDWSRGQLVVKLLRDAARLGGRTVLVVSHDARVADYADRALYLLDGNLVDRLPTDQPPPKGGPDDRRSPWPTGPGRPVRPVDSI
jgi:putative ABC transport system ATP-binding protein